MEIAVIVRARRLRTAFTLVEVLVVMVIIGILTAILLPALNTVRESGRRATCASNLRGMAQALHNYHETFGAFPPSMEVPDGADPGDTELFGPNWVIWVLPFFEQQHIYDEFDLSLPISDIQNRTARGRGIATMLCPSDSGADTRFQGTSAGEGDNWSRGNYAANGGHGALDKSNMVRGVTGPESPGWTNMKYQGVMGANVSLRLDDIRDGTTRTLLLGEIRIGLGAQDRRGVWAMGSAGSSSLYWYGSEGPANGPNVCLSNADAIKGCNLVAAAAGSGLQSKCMPCDIASSKSSRAMMRSVHPGGVNVAMAGGSTHFISDFVETSGPYGTFGTAWDGLIGSNDALLYEDSKWNLDY